MSIMELGALGEFAGSILVLGTLVYLIVQIGQTRRSINASNFVSATLMFNPVNLAAVGDEDLFRLFMTGCNEPESLTDVEASRYHLLLRAYNNNFMSLHWMYEDGSFPAEMWEMYERNYAELLATPGGAPLIDSVRFAAPVWAARMAELQDSIGGTMHFTREGFQRVNPLPT